MTVAFPAEGLRVINVKQLREFHQGAGDGPMEGLGGGGRCFRLSFKWLACRLAGIEFFQYKAGRVMDDPADAESIRVKADFGDSGARFLGKPDAAGYWRLGREMQPAFYPNPQRAYSHPLYKVG
jgi:hypothetical protein